MAYQMYTSLSQGLFVLQSKHSVIHTVPGVTICHRTWCHNRT